MLINFLSIDISFLEKIDSNSNEDIDYKGIEIPLATPRAKDTPTLMLV